MKIAIIGASSGQLALCIKAKEMGIETICFAWEEGAVCKDYVDKFYPISVFEKDLIVEICKKEQIDGVVSNASDILVEVIAFIAEKLNLQGNLYANVSRIKDKWYVRNSSKCIEELSSIWYENYKDNEYPNVYPCVVKPTIGSANKGVFFVNNKEEFISAIHSIHSFTDTDIIIEEYVGGVEVSVESISFNRKHYILQITDKRNSGAPRFVELEHHQPSLIDDIAKNKISIIIPKLLDILGFENGATHIELKITPDNKVFLIEVNQRGGGDEISNQLVYLSTGYDYLKGIIEVALNQFVEPVLYNHCYSGIYYLSLQTKHLLPFFNKVEAPAWLIQKTITDTQLREATGNYDRNGFFIYQGTRKIEESDLNM